MDIRYKLYPYPVLAYFNDDYIDSKFEISSKCVKDGFDINIEVQVILENELLNEMLKHEKVALVYHIECAQTGLRMIRKSFSTSDNIVIQANKVNGELHFCPFIVAEENLLNYYNEKFHPDYSKPIACIEKGCIIAVGQQYNWPIVKSMVDMVNSSSPFIIIKNMDENKFEMVVEYESESKIKIKLNRNDFDCYKVMCDNPEMKSILNSAIVVPALIYVIGQLQKMEDYLDVQDLHWYRAIKESLDKNFNIAIENIKDENALELAQKMLKIPINDALSSMIGLGSREEED